MSSLSSLLPFRTLNHPSLRRRHVDSPAPSSHATSVESSSDEPVEPSLRSVPSSNAMRHVASIGPRSVEMSSDEKSHDSISSSSTSEEAEEEGIVDSAIDWVEEKLEEVVDEGERLWALAVERGRKGVLLCYDELPHEWRGNAYILGGYRFLEHHDPRLLFSALQWHNETINIWSHFLGFLSVLYVAIYHLPSASSSTFPTRPDQAIAGLFLFFSAQCMIASAIYHLLNGCSTKTVRLNATCADFCGISGLIAACLLSSEYYGMTCHSRLRIFYMSFTATMGIIGLIVPWRPWFAQPAYRIWRINFFLVTIFSIAMPILHLSILHGFGRSLVWFFAPTAPSLLSFAAGLVFYAKQFPERSCAGRFDMIGHSHQLWHVAIVAGLWLYWRAIRIWASAATQGLDLSCAPR